MARKNAIKTPGNERSPSPGQQLTTPIGTPDVDASPLSSSAYASQQKPAPQPSKIAPPSRAPSIQDWSPFNRPKLSQRQKTYSKQRTYIGKPTAGASRVPIGVRKSIEKPDTDDEERAEDDDGGETAGDDELSEEDSEDNGATRDLEEGHGPLGAEEGSDEEDKYQVSDADIEADKADDEMEEVDEEAEEEEDEKGYNAYGIIEQNFSRYLIAWMDNPDTGESYEPTWTQGRANVGNELLADWKAWRKRHPKRKERSLRSVQGEETDYEPPARKRGRPKKEETQEAPRKRGRPRKA